MWEVGNALATISAAADAARRNSAMVVLTAGDAGVVQRHMQEFWQMINAGIDMLFCNKYVVPPARFSLPSVIYVCAFWSPFPLFAEQLLNYKLVVSLQCLFLPAVMPHRQLLLCHCCGACNLHPNLHAQLIL